MTERIFATVLLATAAAVISHRTGLLTAGGAAAQWVLATLLFGIGGWQWVVPMLAFFLPASLISHIPSDRRTRAETISSKGAQRDAVQVLANGGVGGLILLMWWAKPETVWYGAYLGAVGAAAADTWGTEIGTMSPESTRLITTLRRVDRGVSGGITLSGYFAGAVGSALIFAAGLPWILEEARWQFALATIGASLAGTTFDSLLGAAVQARYRCVRCGGTTERKSHCGSPSLRISGLSWVSNDVVNLACTGLGGGVGAAFVR
ncbi:MAG: DUF92 domain-containing protein [Bacteroidota bacterium]